MVNFSSEKWFSESSFYPYEIGSSMRFSSENSASLSRAPSSPGNKKTFTWSGWVKLCKAASMRLFGSGTATDEVTDLHIDGTGGNLRFRDKSGDNLRKETTASLRDPSSWYHIVCAVDVTQASNSNRVKLYINGTLQTAFDQDDTFVDRNTYINRTGGNGMVLGKRSFDAASFLEGYMAEVHFIDGTQLTADTFGELKEGVWIPKLVTGVTYGTNGFYLKFDQTGSGTPSSSTMGADSSGNNNHFSQSNINPADSNLPDSPTNKFCTMNHLRNYGGDDIEIGGCKFVSGSSEYGPATSTFAVSSGKWYAELDQNSATTTFAFGGVRTETKLSTGFGLGNAGSFSYRQGGTKGIEGTYTSYGASWSQNDIIGMALNLDDNEVTFYKNNSSQGTFSITAGEYSIACADDTSSAAGAVNLNFGADSSFNNRRTKANNPDENGYGDFFYSPPSGYLCLCAANLPEPTISPLNGDQPSDHFSTLLFDGTGSSPTSFTGVGFQPDLLWIKRRDSASNGHHIWYDAIRGGTNALRSSTDGAEAQFGNTVITAFGADGFTIQGTDGPNASGYNNVAWSWLAGNSTSSNSDGSISSTVSVNAKAGFSIVAYTGSGATSQQTVGCGLSWSGKEKVVIIKNRDISDHWFVNSSILSANKLLTLDQANDDSQENSSGYITYESNGFRTYNGSNMLNLANDYIAYCFHEVEGYSKFGSFTGTGETDGPFVFTGFRPAWLMWKRTSDTNQWVMNDDTRNPNNPNNQVIYANLYDADSTGEGIVTDFVSNGFKLRSSTAGNANTNNSTYIYMAFAEMPFKYANAR